MQVNNDLQTNDDQYREQDMKLTTICILVDDKTNLQMCPTHSQFLQIIFVFVIFPTIGNW